MNSNVSEKDDSEENEEIEFLLQVEDLNSVISYWGNQNDMNLNQYVIGTVLHWKWKADKSLSDLFTPSNVKWVKPDEFLEADALYDMDELHNFLWYRSFGIERNQSKWWIKVGKERDDFFKILHIELLTLSEAYKIPLPKIQELFMDCSCDLKDLKKLLQNDKEAKKYKWSVLEDLALLSE